MKNNDVQLVEKMIKKGFDINEHSAPEPNVENDKGMTPLIQAIENNNLEIASILIKNNADVNDVGAISISPLYAGVWGLMKAIQLKIVKKIY